MGPTRGLVRLYAGAPTTVRRDQRTRRFFLGLRAQEPGPSPALCGPDYTPKMVAAMASCSAAIARLDVGISVSSVASAWARRAAWSGYTRALQLQSAEIDEIDVFSWGCGLQIPGRPLRSTTVDLFDRFEVWATAMADPDPLA